MIRRAWSLAAVALATAVALAGCTSSTNGSGAAARTSPSASTSTSSPAAQTSTAESTAASTSSVASTSSSAGTSTAATVADCLSDIRVIPGEVQAAAGHRVLVLVFNNVSHTTTCRLFGYPGVDLVTASGATVVHLRRTLRGMVGEPAGVTAPAPVILAPGQSASASAEASAFGPGGTDCGDYALLITVPNQTVSVGGGTAMLPKCDAQIHPVVAGTSGGVGG